MRIQGGERGISAGDLVGDGGGVGAKKGGGFVGAVVGTGGVVFLVRRVGGWRVCWWGRRGGGGFEGMGWREVGLMALWV